LWAKRCIRRPPTGGTTRKALRKRLTKVKTNKTIEMLIVVLLGLSIGPLAIHPSRAPVANSNYPVTDFATGFANSGGLGPLGLGPDASSNLYVVDYQTKNVYKFGPAGGVASPTTEFATSTQLGGHTPHGLAVGKDGSIYLNLADAQQIVQLNPQTGAIMRTVASGLGWASGLAVDPLSGDLFVSQSGLGDSIFRVSNFANGPGTVSVYATVPNADGLAFQWNGTLYAASGGLKGIVKISATSSPQPATTAFIISVPSIDGMAVSQKPGRDLTLFGNRNDGIITQVTFEKPGSLPGKTDIFTGGTRGDFETVGRDGCLYATQTDRIIKVANPNGGCPFGGFHDISENLLSCAAPCSSQPRMATVGSYVYAVWLNNTSGDSNLLFSASNNNGSSFGPVVRITNSTNGRASNQQIAAVSSNVFIVWQQNVSLTNDHIFLRRSTNNGTSFGPIVDVSGSGLSSGTSRFPEVAAAGNTADIVWLGCTNISCDTLGGNSIQILFRSSISVGTVTLSTTAYSSAEPQISAVANFVYATWSDIGLGRAQTFFAVSSNGGASFGTALSLSSTPAGETDLHQEMAVAGNSVYVTWTNHTTTTDNTMFAASNSNGGSFAAALNLNKAIVTDLNPQVAASGTNVYVTWSDASGGNTEVVFRASINNGANFGSLLNLSNVPGTSNQQMIAALGINVYVTWIQSGTLNNGVYLASSSDNGSTFGASFNLISDSVSHNPVLADPWGYAYVAWRDDTTGHGDIDIVSGKPFGFDFSIANSGTIDDLPVGTSGSNTINLAVISGTSQTVTLSCSGGLPAGASCTFNPVSGTPGFSTSLTISTQSSTPLGSYTITVTGRAGDLGFGASRSTQFTLTVRDYAVAWSPSTASVTAGTASTTSTAVVATLTSGTTTAATCTVTVPPVTGLAASLSPFSITPTVAPGASQTESITTTTSTPAGVYTISVSCALGGGSRAAQFTLTVRPVSVGGVTVPVNMIDLLVPYIGFASIIATAMLLTATYLKRPKREESKRQLMLREVG
jgi:hypothetical protein